MAGKSVTKSAASTATKRAPGDSFRGGYAAGKAKGGLRPPPASVTKAKATK
jgi:hypothetical protein